MNKASLNVLIVDDDSTQGKALLEAVKRGGYNGEWTASPQQALTLVHHIEFHAILIDCMLPKINGVDLVKQLKPHLVEGADIFLMTGVFKDRAFIKEATEKTLCTHFFVKPFNLEQWTTHLNRSLSKWQGPEEDPNVELYGGPISNLEQWMEKHPDLNTLHLPMLLRQIQQAKLTGQLALSHGSCITFYQGNVCGVKNTDNQSFFGLIAIEKGYVTAEEVEAVLQNQDHRPIGQLLIESLTLSPHAVNIVLAEQIALRLSQGVQDVNVEAHWLKQEIPKPTVQLTPERLNTLFLEWLPSKYDEDWLRALYMRWGSRSLNWLKKLNETVPSQTDSLYDKESDISPLELFEGLLLNEVHVGEKSAPTANYKSMQQKLERALSAFRTASLFQILGLSEKARTNEVNRAYETLRRAFVIPEGDSACPPKVKEMADKVNRLLANAHATLTDETQRSAYMRDLEFKKMQEVSDLEPTFRAAIVELNGHHYAQAIKKFDALISKKAPFKDLKAYRLWALIKNGGSANLEAEFEQIPPEQRYSATYMMARGLFYFSRVQYSKAVEYFKNACMVDPKMKEAHVELERAEDAMQNTQQIRLMRDVKGALDSLFGGSPQPKPKPKKKKRSA